MYINITYIINIPVILKRKKKGHTYFTERMKEKRPALEGERATSKMINIDFVPIRETAKGSTTIHSQEQFNDHPKW